MFRPWRCRICREWFYSFREAVQHREREKEDTP
ncbi:hypothetical protein LCGC14_1179030 [marine sediment metagenome]|uniref:C2H2-type domain-containing protein n=1 Tax=marine sediment metagenome TaxID=412755 RepID=A0A0F9LMV0_9ZZZZ